MFSLLIIFNGTKKRSMPIHYNGFVENCWQHCIGQMCDKDKYVKKDLQCEYRDTGSITFHQKLSLNSFLTGCYSLFIL